MPDERIFISYSTKDGKPCADELRAEFEGLGFSVWQDLVALRGGADWWSQIENALKSKTLQHFILVVTPGALTSAVVRREIRLARQEGKTISPVRGPGVLDLSALPRWLGQVYDLGVPEKKELLKQVLMGPSTQGRVPMMAPEPPADFVQRPVEFEALKNKLLDAKGDSVAITAALRGAGGYGKSTLAKALAHDADIEDAYFDGILWVELGEKPNNLLSIVADLIEVMKDERPGFENLNAAAAKLGEALGDRRVLLVIDDAWREQDLRPFSHGGRNTTRLITTRRDDILPLKTERQPVDAMAANEALALLSTGLPEDQAAAQSHALAALAQRLGEWALLLKLVNGFLRDRVRKSKQPLDKAIAGVNRRLTDKGLLAFDAKNEANRANAIAITIGVSLDLLTEDERARFAELAVFPEDMDVPLGTVVRLWRETGPLDEVDTEDLLQRLQNLSLLLALDLDRRTFRFHDMVRYFLRERADNQALAALHKRLLKALERTEAHADASCRRYYYLYRPAHLSEAGERAALDALLLDPKWLQAKLNALDSPQALIADYERFRQDETQELIGRALRLTSGICARDKRQLLVQLHGRLMSRSAAKYFAARSREVIVPPALITLRPSLTPPGSELMRLEGHDGSVFALAILPDGRLASGSGDRSIRLWDTRTGTELARFTGHESPVRSLAVLPDGRLASGSWDSTIRLWDLKSAAETARLEGHSARVFVFAYLPDGRLASGSDDTTVRLWDLKTGAETARLSHGASVKALAALPHDRLASGSDDGTIRLWELENHTEIAKLEGHAGHVESLALLPDGRLASGSWDKSIRLWDLRSGAETGRLEGHGASIRALMPLSRGRLASGSYDNTIRLWDLKTGTEIARLEGHGASVRALALLPDGRLASGSYDSTIRLWNLREVAETAHIESHGGSVRAFALLLDGRLASGSHDTTIALWNLESGIETGRVEGHSGQVRALASLPDGRLASGANDGAIRLWDPKSGTLTARLGGYGDYVISLAVLPNGHLASSWNNRTIRLWDPKSGEQTAQLGGFRKLVRTLAALPDGRLASASNDKIIRLWDLKMRGTACLEGHRDYVMALAALPNGSLVSGSADKTVRLWDTKTGAETGRLEGHSGIVTALTVLDDGRVVSGSHDRTIRLWNLKTGTETARLEVDFTVHCLAAVGDNRLVAGDFGGRIHWLEILD